MNECLNNLTVIWDNINKRTGCSFDMLTELNNKGKIKKIFDDYKIEESLYNELINFLNLLGTNMYDGFPYLRKIYLDKSSFVEIFNKFGYLLGLHFGNKDVYRKFPLFVKTLVDRYNVEYYKDYTLEQIDMILRDRMSLIYKYDPNTDRHLVEVDKRIPNYYTDYTLYEEKINNNTLDIFDQTEFFIWSEKDTFDREYYELSKYKEYNPNVAVQWVSKNYGDGYGFDILSYDPILKRQKLIETKSGRSKNTILTFPEFSEITTALNHNCDYYIYKYYLDEKNKINLSQLKYDLANECFIDIYTNEEYYPNSYIDDGIINRIKIYLDKEKVYKKI